MLIPPDNFGMVEAGIYRCSKLEADHLPFLETLQLKSLILLDVAKPPRTLRSFLNENKVDLYNLGGLKISNHQNTGSTQDADKKDGGSNISGQSTAGNGADFQLERGKISKNDSWMIIEKNLVKAAFEILLDRQKHPVLVVDSSSALVGILRKIQRWNFNSIVNEYRIYAGISCKISYNIEVFLELISPELVPYELDHALRRRDEWTDIDKPGSLATSPVYPGTPGSAAYALKTPNRRASNSFPVHSPFSSYIHSVRSQRSSVDEGNALYEDDDTASFGDYEEDMDDELLSASPQIPANLLKLAEQRNHSGGVSPSTSPDLRPSFSAANSARSLSLDISHHTGPQHRRRSSVESRYLRANNTRFRDPQFSDSSPRRASLDVSVQKFKMDQERANAEEIERLRERFDYVYYTPGDVHAENFNVIKIRIPPEQNLAAWFVRGRNFWETRYRKSRAMAPKDF